MIIYEGFNQDSIESSLYNSKGSRLTLTHTDMTTHTSEALVHVHAGRDDTAEVL